MRLPPRLRIAMVDPSLFSAPYDAELCRALSGAGHDVVLHCRPVRGEEPYALDAIAVEAAFYPMSERLRRTAGVPSRFSSVLKVPEHALDMWRLVRRLMKDPPDVVHVQWTVVPVVDRLAIQRLRRVSTVIVTAHNTLPMHGDVRRSISTLGWAGPLRAADHVIVHTAHGKTELTAHEVAAAAISVVPHGLLPSGLLPECVSEPPGERSRGGPRSEGPLRILFFGRLRPYKGLDTLLRALAVVLAADEAAARLRVAGDALMATAPLQQLADDLGIGAAVDWDLGFLTEAEADQAMEDADVLALPYRHIDASGVLMKGLLHGKAIVASRISGFTDLIHDGRNGLLVEVDDPADLGAALLRLSHDQTLRSTLEDGAKRSAEAVTSWDAIAQSTEAVYRSVVRQR